MENLVKEVCHDVCVEPHLQLLSREGMFTYSASIKGSGRLDVKAAWWLLGEDVMDTRSYFPVLCATYVIALNNLTSNSCW